MSTSETPPVKSNGCTGIRGILGAGFPKVVCLCGSGRFLKAFEEAEARETLDGRIVLTIGCNTRDVARTPDMERHKPALDELHLRKIDLADEVLVLNVGGYVGDSTGNELAYALALGKPVRTLEPMDLAAYRRHGRERILLKPISAAEARTAKGAIEGDRIEGDRKEKR